jgi:raffinose/stachyose/melibiose transport system permease protein
MSGKNVSLLLQRKRDTRRVATVFLAPVSIILFIFIVYPIISTFTTSFYQWDGISANKIFNGIDNWVKISHDMSFWIAFKNNLIIMVLSIAIQIPIGLALATLLDFVGKKLNIAKVIWFIPLLMSSVAVGFLFKYALATNGGIISTISNFFGGKNIDLLGDKRTALFTVIAVICWQFIPF